MPSKKLTISRSSEKTTATATLEPRENARPQKVGFVSLGCPKNLVDSEVMMGLLARAGAELSPRAEDADVIVVNTCSFIESAQQESVNAILEMAAHKTAGRAKKLVVAGCLVERFRDEILKRRFYKELTEQLASSVSIAPSDVMVAIIENSAADWSFGNGEPQFLTGELA